MNKVKAMLIKEAMISLNEKAIMAGFKLKQFSSTHCRLYGKVQIDYWPSTGKAWIVGSKKSFVPKSLNELISVAEKEKWPEGALLKNAPPELLSEYFDPKELCVCCGNRIETFRNPNDVSLF